MDNNTPPLELVVGLGFQVEGSRVPYYDYILFYGYVVVRIYIFVPGGNLYLQMSGLFSSVRIAPRGGRRVRPFHARFYKLVRFKPSLDHLRVRRWAMRPASTLSYHWCKCPLHDVGDPLVLGCPAIRTWTLRIVPSARGRIPPAIS